MLERKSLPLLDECLKQLEQGFGHLPDFEAKADIGRLRDVLSQVAERLQDNYPYAHPLYAGQMLKPPHPIARLAYALALWLNPNNHALDGGRASSAMEKEAVAALAELFGWHEHIGHLCSGGTMANLEALWVAGRLRPGQTILASRQAHYTHRRLADVLQLDFESVPVDARTRMDPIRLEELLQKHKVSMVVATLGTTGVGAVDPLPAILELQAQYGFRIHVDAAYGGYYRLVDNLGSDTRAAFDCLDQVDSIVIDPHKHGLQPYGCGCVLFHDPAVANLYQHNSPYTYFSSDDLHLGQISLECSRPGASAVALWATQQLLPLEKGGVFANDLSRCREAALCLFRRLQDDPRYLTVFAPELDIIVWAPKSATSSAISNRSKRQFAAAADRNLHLALVDLPAELCKPHWPDVAFDQSTVCCLRSCLMKPEHIDWLDQIWEVLDAVAD